MVRTGKSQTDGTQSSWNTKLFATTICLGKLRLEVDVAIAKRISDLVLNAVRLELRAIVVAPGAEHERSETVRSIEEACQCICERRCGSNL